MLLVGMDIFDVYRHIVGHIYGGLYLTSLKAWTNQKPFDDEIFNKVR